MNRLAGHLCAELPDNDLLAAFVRLSLTDKFTEGVWSSLNIEWICWCVSPQMGALTAVHNSHHL